MVETKWTIKIFKRYFLMSVSHSRSLLMRLVEFLSDRYDLCSYGGFSYEEEREEFGLVAKYEPKDTLTWWQRIFNTDKSIWSRTFVGILYINNTKRNADLQNWLMNITEKNIIGMKELHHEN